MENKDQSAFPFESEVTDNYGVKYKQIQSFGLTKLEHLAGLAMQGICSNQSFINNLRQEVDAENNLEKLVSIASIEISKELLNQLEKEHGK